MRGGRAFFFTAFLTACFALVLAAPGTARRGTSGSHAAMLTTPLSQMVEGRRFSVILPAGWRIREQYTPRSNWDKLGVDCLLLRTSPIPKRRGTASKAGPAPVAPQVRVSLSTDLTSRAERHGAFDGIPLRLNNGLEGVITERSMGPYPQGEPSDESDQMAYRWKFKDAVVQWCAVRLPTEDNKAVLMEVVFEKSDRHAAEPLARALFRSLHVYPMQSVTATKKHVVP